MYAEAFSLDRKIFLETGTPRNDIFFSEHPEIKKRVQDFYHISEQTKILLLRQVFR